MCPHHLNVPLSKWAFITMRIWGLTLAIIRASQNFGVFCNPTSPRVSILIVLSFHGEVFK
ncbi:hypothetical protein BGZ60DRAFT_415247 [Tricladium varicosporioides]|nr:hypothetical protein BGZ60DRAFT_415247 [Hymenoscyphus varicosporioides]